MLHAWRIFQARHAGEAFSGEGARRYGGRFNNKGTAVVYTAGSAALAALEVLVHLESYELLGNFLLVEVTFDERLVEDLDPRCLPDDWRSDPPPLALRRLGDRWVAERRSAVLRVPNVLIEAESNYLLNPAHADFRCLAVGPPRPFSFDPRLAKHS